MKRSNDMIFKVCAVALALILIPALASAQNPDFTGTWKFNESESEMPEFGGGGSGGGFGVTQITIKQEDDEITITRPENRGGMMMGGGTQVLKVDGKPHERTTEMGSQTIMTSWKEGKLVVETIMSFGDRGEMISVTNYSLSEDGQKLTQSVEMDTPMGAMGYKLVYDLQK